MVTADEGTADIAREFDISVNLMNYDVGFGIERSLSCRAAANILETVLLTLPGIDRY